MKLALAAVVAIAAAAGAQAMSSGPTLNNCGKLVTKPRTFMYYCADRNFRLTQLVWSSWGGSSAAARGHSIANDCKPSCIIGTFRGFPVKVKASAVKSCGKHKEYSKLTITYTRALPPGFHRTEVNRLRC